MAMEDWSANSEFVPYNLLHHPVVCGPDVLLPHDLRNAPAERSIADRVCDAHNEALFLSEIHVRGKISGVLLIPHTVIDHGNRHEVENRSVLYGLIPREAYIVFVPNVPNRKQHEVGS